MAISDFPAPEGHKGPHKNLNFTNIPGNPAHDMMGLYRELMDFGPDTTKTDPNGPEARAAAELLATRAIAIAKSYVKSGENKGGRGTSGGMSPMNFRKFEMAMKDVLERLKPLDNAKSLITNFLLRAMGGGASGFGVLYTGKKGPYEEVEINTIGNLLNEEGQYRIDITPELRDFIQIANRHGFEINIAESEEQAWELGGMNISESKKCEKCKKDKCICKANDAEKEMERKAEQRMEDEAGGFTESKDPHKQIKEALAKKKAIKEI